nr:alginate export family protein [FCB group bacterium]
MRKVLAAVIILLMAGSLYAQCAKDCTKPCCAKKSEMTQCAKDCTKPCCAKKQGVGCEISACKTQASCGIQSDCSASSCSTPNCSKSRSNSRLDISGEVRYRFQWDGKDFNDDSSAPNYSELRTRLNFKFKPSYDTKVFLQLQDSRTLGEVTENDPLFGTPVMDGSADNLDLHQGYFQIQGLFGLCLDMQVGRMESAFGSERIMGNVG